MLTEVSLFAFRNYLKQVVPLSPGVNLFLGANAQGKTNLLEALYLGATGRSPRSALLAEMVMWEQAGARVVLDFEEGGRKRCLEVRLERDPASTRTRRTIRLDEKPMAASAHAGRIRVVLFHPEEMTLVRGSGEARRRLVNGLLSQAEPAYSGLLSRYQRLLEQRNQLLKRVQQELEPPSALGWWTEELARAGGGLVEVRARRLGQVAPLVAARHAEISGGERLEVAYAPSVPLSDDPARALAQELYSRQREEIARGVTVAGPHRDDLTFTLAGLPAASHASQGQQRTAILAFKLAEVELLTEGGGSPVLLLDDVMSELDAPRRAHLLRQVEASAQSVITSAEAAYFPEGFTGRVRARRVEAGALLEEK
ncbi:MAG: DNA replication/repair protein RecF [Candidatus Dormibacteria bacterium]